MLPWLAATGLSVLLYSSGLFIIFTPLPIAALCVKKGYASGVGAFLVAFLVLASLYHFAAPLMIGRENWAIPVLPLVPLAALFTLPQITFLGLVQFSYYGVMGIMLVVAAGTERIEKGVGKILLVSVVLVGGGIYLFQGLFQVSMPEKIRETIQIFFDQWVKATQEAGAKGDDVKMVTRELVPTLVNTLYYLLPSLFICGTMINLSFNMIILRRWLMGRKAFRRWRDFGLWQLPEVCIWLPIFLGGLFFLNKYLLNQTAIQWVTLNLLVILAMVYFFQGAAILAFYWKRGIPPLAKILLYVVFFVLFQIVIVIMTLAGLFDFWFDFRKLKRDSSRSGSPS